MMTCLINNINITTSLKNQMNRKPPKEVTLISVQPGKALSLDNNWSDQLDNPMPELNPCIIILYVKDKLTG